MNHQTDEEIKRRWAEVDREWANIERHFDDIGKATRRMTDSAPQGVTRDQVYHVRRELVPIWSDKGSVIALLVIGFMGGFGFGMAFIAEFFHLGH